MFLEGTIIDGQIVLDNTPTLAEGTRVKVEVTEAAPTPSLYERYKDIIGVIDDLQSDKVDDSKTQPAASLTTLLRYAGKVTDLPEDMALNHDHYLHGAAKR